MTDLAHAVFCYDSSPAFFPLHYVEDPPRRRPANDADDTTDLRIDPAQLQVVPSQFARQVFGTNLRRARRLANLSQQQFAALAGISRSYVGEVEHARHNICIDRMETLASALGMTLDALLDPGLYAPGKPRHDN